MNKIQVFLLSAVCSVALSACTNNENAHNSNEGFVLSSPQMVNGGKLPKIYTCDGDKISPPLSWQGAPESTQYYALIMDHNAPDGVHWYWTLYNIPANQNHMKSGEALGEIGSNSVNGLPEYTPPCSKGPGEKSYSFTLYALSDLAQLDDSKTTASKPIDSKPIDRATLLAAIKDITLDSANLTVTNERPSNNHSVRDDKSKPQRRPKPIALTPPTPSQSIDSPRCDAIRSSVSDAGFEQDVTVTCDKEYAYVISSTYPDHPVMTGITGTNEQIPVPAKGYAAPIKLHPSKADSLTTIDAAVGVAVNGVPIYDYSSQGELDIHEYDEKHDTLVLGQLDNCGGHAGRGDDYHYHVAPNCMMDVMKNQDSDAIIGWGYDGYPLYGNKNPDGSDIATGTLDVCNGQSDDEYGYRYQTSTTPPYIIQCLVGQVNTRVLPRVSPLSGDKNGIRADLRPPRDGVENLTYTMLEDGSRTMRYDYQGEEYFTTYRPSSQGNDCYDFTQKTISNGGKLESGTFCRTEQEDKAPTNDAKPRKPNDASENGHVSQNSHVSVNTAFSGEHNLKLEAWADNWFAAYIGDQLLVEDSVSITTERSFNAESVSFSANYPIELNVIIKDFKQNDTGLEYIGARNQQMGDGGLILQITDTDTNEVIAVSDNNWQCEVLHKAPLNKLCESESDPVAGQGYCTFISKDAPDNWLQSGFDTSQWQTATVHPASAVGPKDGYNEIDWDNNAQFIWGDDLETDNTIICKTTINPAE